MTCRFSSSATYTPATRPAGRAPSRTQEPPAAAADRGLILGSGPFAAGEDPPGAAMIYEAAGRQVVVDVVEGDPFRTHGFVASYDITEWIPMIGPWAVAAVGGRS